MAVPAAMPDRRMPTETADRADAAKAAARGKPVDEECGRPIGFRQTAFQHGDLERQVVAFELGLLQDNNGILDRRSIAVHHGYRRIRRITGEAVVALVPLLDEIGREHVPCRPHRAIGEHDGIRRYAGHGQLFAFELRAPCVEDRERRHHFRRAR